MGYPGITGIGDLSNNFLGVGFFVNIVRTSTGVLSINFVCLFVQCISFNLTYVQHFIDLFNQQTFSINI